MSAVFSGVPAPGRPPGLHQFWFSNCCHKGSLGVIGRDLRVCSCIYSDIHRKWRVLWRRGTCVRWKSVSRIAQSTIKRACMAVRPGPGPGRQLLLIIFYYTRRCSYRYHRRRSKKRILCASRAFVSLARPSYAHTYTVTVTVTVTLTYPHTTIRTLSLSFTIYGLRPIFHFHFPFCFLLAAAAYRVAAHRSLFFLSLLLIGVLSLPAPRQALRIAPPSPDPTLPLPHHTASLHLCSCR